MSNELPAGPFVEGIGVTVGIEIGRVTFPLRELLDLVPGSVLDLPLPAEGTVTLTLGGTVIAEARIVREAGNFSLEIVKTGESQERF